jgi:glycine cleavage system H protein
MTRFDIPNELTYTKDHIYVRRERDGETVTVGITAFAVDALGDITLVAINLRPGDHLSPGKAFGTIESVMTLTDLFSPLSGMIDVVNQQLLGTPGLVNDDPYGKAWMLKIRMSDPHELYNLLSASAYEELVKDPATPNFLL